MLYEDTDAGLVRMFECFLEAAPQLVLQLFILFREIKDDGLDGINDLVEHGHLSKNLFLKINFFSSYVVCKCHFHCLSNHSIISC